MPSRVGSHSIRRARGLRRDMTDGERRLWSELKEFRRLYGVHVRRQVPIGPYFADFAIHEHRLVIEVDGEHHFTSEGLKRDARRDAWLVDAGYRVMRLTTADVSDSFEGCVVEILGALGLMGEPDGAAQVPPPYIPPLKGEGGSEILPLVSTVEDVGATPTSPSPLRGGIEGGGNLSTPPPFEV